MIKAYFKLNYQVNPFWRGNETYFMEDLENKSPLKTSYMKNTENVGGNDKIWLQTLNRLNHTCVWKIQDLKIDIITSEKGLLNLQKSIN